MSKAASKRLFDAMQACVVIAEITAGKDFAAYSADRILRYAVERQFEIIGEALGRAVRLDGSLLIDLPDLPNIVAFRNRLIHGYDSVDDAIVWSIVREELPSLETDLRGWLHAHGDV
jgi:uncharacterized protein with HEPN domain